MKNIIQKIVVAGVIIRNGKILILQRNKDEKIFPSMWELPSGKKEYHESTADSLYRELKEETGIDGKILYPISVFDYEIEKKDVIVDTTQINFLVIPANEECKVTISSEHQDFRWISGSETESYKISDETNKVIKIAFDLINKIPSNLLRTGRN